MQCQCFELKIHFLERRIQRHALCEFRPESRQMPNASLRCLADKLSCVPFLSPSLCNRMVILTSRGINFNGYRVNDDDYPSSDYYY